MPIVGVMLQQAVSTLRRSSEKLLDGFSLVDINHHQTPDLPLIVEETMGGP
ncbi:hypothetical protein I314_03881 [Cryptococcus bacillisporus CA1873]|uniref:Uncharacterized protein n=2 Tax=Cryptococcus gattii TaxID=552467 RepID=A0A0D0VH74_CRYGA|nr:hypothetical protein I312_03697 [Cryptococcus bacillisporus CA1280]KIR60030.1 hypothetical protein I314_03881 [Cryptococcus bacillisporus CA1873]|eukprot:KIR60030.1 hypothetical protein I314_03881 [Cryptococcus gattii CA1873]